MGDLRDVVLITIDSWRVDAISMMSTLKEVTEDWNRTIAVTQSAATHGAFASLLAGKYSVQVYDRNGLVRPDVTTLADVLGRAGYSTGAVLASNPFLAKWDVGFDHYWNDGMRTDRIIEGGRWYPKADLAKRFVTLSKRVPARTIASRSDRWYQTAERPRFLWLHLMDIHSPYLPGIRLGREVGLLRTYATLYQFHVAGDRSSDLLERVRTLYHQCVRRLDAIIEEVLDIFDDDAIIVLTGDHGEEFDHGNHGHARLYDECVTTPLFVRNASLRTTGSTVRHLDIAPTILDEIGVDRPGQWEGYPVDGSTRPSFLFNHAPGLERTFLGVRTDTHKFIKTYHDKRWTVRQRELYDLRSDPDERNHIDDDELMAQFDRDLDEFLERDDVDIEVIRSTTSGIDDQAQDRLRELGYL